MSQSTCINCGQPVSMYEKYCTECVTKHKLQQDHLWHKTHSIWNLEFELKNDKARFIAENDKPAMPAIKAKRNGRRVPCAGGCGEMVLKTIGECRKCRRKRILKGRRRLYTLEKQARAEAS